MKYRDRILGHRKLKAADLKPHPLNWRTHPDGQKAAVLALMDEVGLARSVLAYVADADKPSTWSAMTTEQRRDAIAHCPAAALTLIDGHGRREWVPGEEVTVEVLDVNDEEARKLLLSLDPTAALAGRDDEALAQLRATTDADSAALSTLWQSLAEDEKAQEQLEEARGHGNGDDEPDPEQFLVIVTCRNERHQSEVLAACQKRGWKCKPVLS